VGRRRHRHQREAREALVHGHRTSLLIDTLDDLLDKTLRGFEGRALTLTRGLRDGNVAYGSHPVPVIDEHGTTFGNRIKIHEAEAKIIVRIF
jgi:hypothetical protein